MRELQRLTHADEDEWKEAQEIVKQVKRTCEENVRLKREIREAERESVVCGDEIHDLGLELTRKKREIEESQAIERGALDPRPPQEVEIELQQNLVRKTEELARISVKLAEFGTNS